MTSRVASLDRVFALILFDVGPEVSVDGAQQICPADDLLHSRDTQCGEMAANIFGDVPEEHHDLVGATRELRPQILPLRRNTDRASVEVTPSDHLAAHCEKRQRPEAEPLGAQQGGHNHITSGAETPVSLQNDP